MTNYERLKSMSIEEMTLFLSKVLDCCRDCIEDRSACDKECPMYSYNRTNDICVDYDIKDWLESEVTLLNEIGVQGCNDVVSAIEKQIPKKPEMKSFQGFTQQVASQLCCPNCSKPVINYWNKKINPPHCMICGQALDWSENNG